MKTSINTFAAILFLFCMTLDSNSQDKSISEKYQNEVYVIKPVLINDLKTKPQTDFSNEERNIIDQMITLKNENHSVNGEKILELQKKLDAASGKTITKEEVSFGIASNFSNNSFQNDNLSLTQIYSGTSVKGIATQLQQNYSGAGTIWTAIAVGLTDTGVAASGDTLIVYRSNDLTGTTYSEMTRIYIGAANKFYPHDAIDMEIVELNNFTSYVYIVYNYTTLGYTGNQKVGCAVIRDNPFLVNNFNINFPGSTSPVNNYLRPRITSDIGTYPNSPYVTIVLTQDSAASTLDNWYMSKYCRILSPFSTTPAITYLPQSIYAPTGPLSQDMTFTVQTDIAYISSTSGVNNKMIFALSGYPQLEPYFFIYKTNSTLMSFPYNSTVYSQTSNNDLEFFRIASNGGPGQNQLRAISSDNYLNTGDWDESKFQTDDVTDGIDNWSAVHLDFSTKISRYGDIIGRRKTLGSYAYNYTNEIGCSFINNAYLLINNLNSKCIQSLNFEYSNSFAAPKPAFRYVNNDSSLSFYGSPYQVFARGGDKAPLTVDLRLNIQGLYDINTDLNVIDDRIYLYLANSSPPYNIVDSATNFLCSNNNTGSYVFNDAPAGNYYVVVKHRNSIETWMYAAMNFTTINPVEVDMTFTNNAYGGNMIQVNTIPVRYALYSGDTNQDGIIDVTDVINIYNDLVNLVTGYYIPTDLTGDSFVDVSDLLMAYNNANEIVSVIRP